VDRENLRRVDPGGRTSNKQAKRGKKNRPRGNRIDKSAMGRKLKPAEKGGTDREKRQPEKLQKAAHNQKKGEKTRVNRAQRAKEADLKRAVGETSTLGGPGSKGHSIGEHLGMQKTAPKGTVGFLYNQKNEQPEQ